MHGVFLYYVVSYKFGNSEDPDQTLIGVGRFKKIGGGGGGARFRILGGGGGGKVGQTFRWLETDRSPRSQSVPNNYISHTEN